MSKFDELYQNLINEDDDIPSWEIINSHSRYKVWLNLANGLKFKITFEFKNGKYNFYIHHNRTDKVIKKIRNLSIDTTEYHATEDISEIVNALTPHLDKWMATKSFKSLIGE